MSGGKLAITAEIAQYWLRLELENLAPSVNRTVDSWSSMQSKEPELRMSEEEVDLR